MGMTHDQAPETSSQDSQTWFLYLLRLRDDSLYCGITVNLEQRLAAHRRGSGSKLVRSRLPFALVYVAACGTKSEAMKRECAMKRLSKQEKEALVLKAEAPPELTVLTEVQLEELVDLAMQDTVPLKAIATQFGLTVDEVVAQMRRRLSANSYRRWKERRDLPAFRKQSRQKPQKHRVQAT